MVSSSTTELMTPAPQLMASKVGVALGVTLLAFGGYVVISYVARGGHAMTLLRALVALPVGVVAIYLSFGWKCSVCGKALERSELDTAPARAETLALAAAAGDGTGAARAFEAARLEQGAVHVSVEFCSTCRRLARVRVKGMNGGANG